MTWAQPERDLDRRLDECEYMFMASVVLACDASLGDWDLGWGISDGSGNHGIFPDRLEGMLGPEGCRWTLGPWPRGEGMFSNSSGAVDVVW